MSDTEEIQEFRWITVDNQPGEKQLPKWRRSAAMDSKGQIYAPAILCGNENAVFLCANFDGESCLENKGHAYFRLEWMKREYPHELPLFEAIERTFARSLSAEAEAEGVRL